MSRRFKTVSSLQRRIVQDIVDAIKDKIADYCIEVAKKNIQRNVYDVYIPQGEASYDRTFDLLNAVTVGDITVGSKYVQFELYMDSEKINPQLRGDGAWNAHADIFDLDVSEYIPLWIEEGTEGSLWDREGAYYMEATNFDLGGGNLARQLADALRSQGWKVIHVA